MKAIHFYKSSTGRASSMGSSSHTVHTCQGVGGRYQVQQPSATLQLGSQNVSANWPTRVGSPRCTSTWVTSLCHVSFHSVIVIRVQSANINLLAANLNWAWLNITLKRKRDIPIIVRSGDNKVKSGDLICLAYDPLCKYYQLCVWLDRPMILYLVNLSKIHKFDSAFLLAFLHTVCVAATCFNGFGKCSLKVFCAYMGNMASALAHQPKNSRKAFYKTLRKSCCRTLYIYVWAPITYSMGDLKCGSALSMKGRCMAGESRPMTASFNLRWQCPLGEKGRSRGRGPRGRREAGCIWMHAI